MMTALLLAGCAGHGATPTHQETSSAPTTAAAATTTHPAATTTTSAPPPSDPGKGPNHAPSADLSASIAGGSLPLLVNFTLGGADPDGDALTYTFAPAGNGSMLASGVLPTSPIHANFTYSVGGIYNATLTVSDGTATKVTVVKVNVTAGAGAKQVVSGSFFLDNPACAGGAYDALPSNDNPSPPPPDSHAPDLRTDGLTYIKFAVAPGTTGLPFKASFASGAIIDHILYLDAAGKKVVDIASADATKATPTDPFAAIAWDIAGTVPATAASVVFYGCANLAGESLDSYQAGA
jgi:PKD repeat protein